MNARDLRPLAERFTLGPESVTALTVLADLLASDPLAPTTVRDRQAILDDHLADSLVGLDLDELQAARSLLDIGAGAGLPGLALAAAKPTLSVTLNDANGRKCAFMCRAADAMGLTNVAIIHARAEELVPSAAGSVDVVTARALARLDVVAEYAAPLLRVGGVLIAWRGRPEPEVEADAARAAPLLGLEIGAVHAVRPYPAAEHRTLHVLTKVADTPSRFPRRVGMARKRPLGAT